jgi:23S rRNA pseudouridine1911/1915/1917 synthase
MDIKVWASMNQGWVYLDRVRDDAAGLTLLEFYTRRYAHSSLSDWQDRILGGAVLLNGISVSAETPLQVGQTLSYHRPPWQEPEVPLTFEVLYEDSDLLVVVKPSGLPVLPGGGFLENTLLHQLRHLYPHETPVPIHRLGRGTSGLMLLARSPLAKSNLSQQMRKSTAGGGRLIHSHRPIHKIYRALVSAGNMPDRFSINQPIGKIAHEQLGYIYGATTDGQFARSDVKVLRRDSESTLVEVTIFTGRPHQIRIHMATAGFPLLGDPLYGLGGIPRLFSEDGETKQPVPGDCGYALHAYRLVFLHPRTQEEMNFECPAPNALSIS